MTLRFKYNYSVAKDQWVLYFYDLTEVLELINTNLETGVYIPTIIEYNGLVVFK